MTSGQEELDKGREPRILWYIDQWDTGKEESDKTTKKVAGERQVGNTNLMGLPGP